MLFHTWPFFLFLLIVLPVFFALRKTRMWLPWLTVASYFFYGWWNPYYLFLVVYSTVLDFCLDGQPLETALKHPPGYKADLQPMMIEREPVDDNFLTTIASMKHVINHANYRDIVLFLSRVHFYKDVSLGVFFDWLIGICEGVEDKSLLEKSVSFKEYMMNYRELAQRFSL